LAKKLRIDDHFTPCPVDTEDELYANGIFEFNITEIIAYIQDNLDHVTLEEIAVSDLFAGSSSINASHVDSVDISQPVIVAEISPGRYNVIDGNHRMEKARRMGIKSMRAYKLDSEQHTKILTSEKAYVTYIEYWNSKLKECYRQ
jgi:ParB-like nuclease family protein